MGGRRPQVTGDETGATAFGVPYRTVSGFGWELFAWGDGLLRTGSVYGYLQAITRWAYDPAVLAAFVAGDLPPWALADYLEDRGVKLPGRVYEMLRGGLATGFSQAGV